MTDKEKAKAYDKLLIKAKHIYNKENDVPIMHTIKDLFPEVKESEDEKIRKALIDGFTVMKESKNCGKTFSNHNIHVADILAWLEKQKPNDNVNLNEDVDRILEENDWDYNEIDFYEFAKHFFELGLKTQKGG